MGTADIEAAMAAGMAAENRRRELAGQSPGLGALLSLPQTVNGPGVGIWDLGMPVIGESHQAAPYVPQHKSFGPVSPVYADGVVGGLGYAPGAVQTAVRHVSDIGDGRLLIEPRADGSNAPVQLVSPDAAPRRSLLGRALARLRRR
jgi:hypothetical protein